MALNAIVQRLANTAKRKTDNVEQNGLIETR